MRLRHSLLVWLALLCTAAPAQPLARQVDAVGITVSDLDRAVAFYSHVLHFTKVNEEEHAGEAWEHLEGVFGLRTRTARLQLGDEAIELTEYLVPRGRPVPPDSRSNDRWFQHIAIIVSDMDRAYQWLRQNRVEFASSGPQTLPASIPNAAGISAFYFKDPDGHPVEILHFPPDKGAAKWHVAAADPRLFLGIDHTAIVVEDTAASLRFYRDTLGMTVAGESENFGTEQEHLNNVFGARLHITALRAAAGLGVELLEYESPRDGRAMPADERANDLVHHQTVMLTADANAAARALAQARAPLVSSGVVAPGSGGGGALLVRDPDGHVIELREP